jgi:hypothetical protein
MAFPTRDYGGVPHDRTRVQTPRLGSCPCGKRKSIYIYSPVRGSTSRGSDWELALDAEELAPSVCPALMFQCLSNLCLALSPGNVRSIRGDRGRSRPRCPLAMTERASQLRSLACQRGENYRASLCPPTGEPPTFNFHGVFVGVIYRNQTDTYRHRPHDRGEYSLDDSPLDAYRLYYTGKRHGV